MHDPYEALAVAQTFGGYDTANGRLFTPMELAHAMEQRRYFDADDWRDYGDPVG